MTPPPHKSNAIRLVKFANSFFSRLACLGGGSSFLPYLCKRASASACVNPRMLLFINAQASAGDTYGIFSLTLETSGYMLFFSMVPFTRKRFP